MSQLVRYVVRIELASLVVIDTSVVTRFGPFKAALVAADAADRDHPKNAPVQVAIVSTEPVDQVDDMDELDWSEESL